MSDQIVIQVLLLVGVGVVAALLTRSTANARHQAIRRILLVGFVLVAAVSWSSRAGPPCLAGRGGAGGGAARLPSRPASAFLAFSALASPRLGALGRNSTAP